MDTTHQRVTVTVPRTGGNGIETFFARAFGWQKMNVVAHATAESSIQAAGSHCVKPFFLPNTILSSSPSTACYSQAIFNQGQVTPFAQSMWGTQLNLRPIQPSGALEPSQFFSIQLGGPGAATQPSAAQSAAIVMELGARRPEPIPASGAISPWAAAGSSA